MFADADDVARDTTIVADVCIVGAGPAGITIARELAADSAPSVVVLESGGFEVEPATEDLYRAANRGEPYPVEASRQRAFGGSTGHWGGTCRPLDAEDFEARDWIPFSGWPFPKRELEPYYERAQRVCELGPYAYDLDAWRDRLPDELDTVNDDRLGTALFQRSLTRFGERYRDDLERADLTVYLHANVVTIATDPSGSRVEEVEVATLAGNRFGVRAGTVVLATGGIEVARLLLASPGAGGNGLGNEHDLVGRFFMEHPQGRLGSAAIIDTHFDPGLYDGVDVEVAGDDASALLAGAFVIPPARRAAEHLLGFSVTLFVLAPPPDARLAAVDVGSVAADIAGSPSWVPVAVLTTGEQVPNPESRVTLGAALDPLGVPRAELHWNLAPADRASMARSLELLAAELGSRGLGRLRIDVEDLALSAHPMQGASHHMGTARMHRDPDSGVVDEHGRVHGVDNLYVAGSAVFPTSGYANPTLTIVALALRLAERLSEVAR